MKQFINPATTIYKTSHNKINHHQSIYQHPTHISHLSQLNSHKHYTTSAQNPRSYFPTTSPLNHHWIPTTPAQTYHAPPKACVCQSLSLLYLQPDKPREYPHNPETPQKAWEFLFTFLKLWWKVLIPSYNHHNHSKKTHYMYTFPIKTQLSTLSPTIPIYPYSIPTISPHHHHRIPTRFFPPDYHSISIRLVLHPLRLTTDSSEHLCARAGPLSTTTCCGSLWSCPWHGCCAGGCLVVLQGPNHLHCLNQLDALHLNI